ncbi:MAG: baseplate J/gp47 family protein [Sphingobacteriaceae bacterium]|nr:baseplate J/gp47 family protein [Sphingobacteriaceae bacterium]
MARSTAEIENSIISEASIRMPNLSKSKTAEWRIWVNIVAVAISYFENILDVFKQYINAQLEQKQAGSLTWYIDQVLKYQHGDDLIIDEMGRVKYAVIDGTKQIVKICSINETSSMALQIKLATLGNDGKFMALDDLQRLGFLNYINKVRFLGTPVQVLSLPADVINYSIQIYCADNADPNIVKSAVKESLQKYATTIKFGGKIYYTQILASIMSTKDVVTANIISLTAIQNNKTVDISDAYELVSGYFNYDDRANISINLIADKI